MLQTAAQYIGYLASVGLILSLIAKTDLKFRIWNMLGCFLFIIYALLIKAWPVLVPNAILFVINVVYLFKISNKKESFDIVQMNENELLLHKFLDFYADDIKSYYPTFSKSQLEGNMVFVVLRDLVIANVFAAKVDSLGEAQVTINYTVPKYRDYKIGNFLFGSQKSFLTTKGIKRVVYNKVHHPGHEKFLEISGFTQADNGGYAKEL